uniref:EGF-like domain-containing protein n=1 Tax=Parastrongyloides trichosuri TaxID=131310 RepID=A0A0N4ZQP0_PARTI
MQNHGRNLCEYNPCLNSGVCQWPVVNESYFGCKCQPCYSGPFCERRDCNEKEKILIPHETFIDVNTTFNYIFISFGWFLSVIALVTILRFSSKVKKIKEKEDKGDIVDCTDFTTHEDSLCSSLYDATHGETRKKYTLIGNNIREKIHYDSFNSFTQNSEINNTSVKEKNVLKNINWNDKIMKKMGLVPK